MPLHRGDFRLFSFSKQFEVLNLKIHHIVDCISTPSEFSMKAKSKKKTPNEKTKGHRHNPKNPASVHIFVMPKKPTHAQKATKNYK